MDVPAYSVCHVAINAGATTYGQLFGPNGQGLVTDAARVKTNIQNPGTYRNLAVYVRANTRTVGTATVNTFLSPSTVGNGSISITDASTGWFEDTSNTDSFDDGEEWSCRIVGFTTGVLTITCIQGMFQNTTGNFQILCPRLLDWNGTVTQYANLAHDENGYTTTATAHAVNIPFDATLRNLYANCDNYTRTGGTYDRMGTYQIEAAALGNVTITVTATGAYEDTSNTDTVTAGERWCLAFTTDRTAGSCRLRGPAGRIELHPTDAADFLFLANRGADGGNNDVDCYLALSGNCNRWSSGVNDTRANMQHRADVAFTWSNLWGEFLGAVAIIRSDINGSGAVGSGNGNQTVTMAAGEVTDTVNTDAVAVDDLIAWGSDYQSGGAFTWALSSMGSVAAAAGGAFPFRAQHPMAHLLVR